ncbi:MAG: hypothetical protein AAFR61_30485 [Bacteroidota bacterium]
MINKMLPPLSRDSWPRCLAPPARVLGTRFLTLVLFFWGGVACLLAQQDGQNLFPSAKLKIELEAQLTEADGPQEKASFYYQPTSNGDIRVEVTATREGQLNPYQLSYAYQIQKNESQGYLMDMQGVAEPFLFYLHEKAKLNYVGDQVEFPAELASNASLASAKGIFTVSLPDQSSIQYQISLTNRTVSGQQEIKLGREYLQAWVIKGDYQRMTLINGEEVDRKKIPLTQWLIPGQGIVKQSLGKLRMTPTVSN